MTGKQVRWYFIGFFSIIAAVNAAMISVAIRTHSGVVTEHPYETGLSYNRVIEAENKQKMLGWKAAITYHDGALNFVLRDKNNQPLAWEKATAAITRPTQQGIDFTVALRSEKTPVAFPKHGLWEVRVNAEYKGMHYQQSKRIVVE